MTAQRVPPPFQQKKGNILRTLTINTQMAKGGRAAALESSLVPLKRVQRRMSGVQKKASQRHPKKNRSLSAWKMLLRGRDKKNKVTNAQIHGAERAFQSISDTAEDIKRIIAERFEAFNADSGSAPEERYRMLADLTKRALTYMDKEASAAAVAAAEMKRLRKIVSDFTRATIDEINVISFDARVILAREEARTITSKGERPACATSLVNMFQLPNEESKSPGSK